MCWWRHTQCVLGFVTVVRFVVWSVVPSDISQASVTSSGRPAYKGVCPINRFNIKPGKFHSFIEILKHSGLCLQCNFCFVAAVLAVETRLQGIDGTALLGEMGLNRSC